MPRSMTFQGTFLWCVALVLTLNAAARADTVLTFDAAVPGTIADANGAGTGFTHRLPGTGGSLASNDPQMTLRTTDGQLWLQSTRSDINGAVNLGNLDAPGFLLTGVGDRDFSVTADFRDVFIPNLSDQMEVYVGASASSVLRAGVHDSYQFIFTENNGGGDYSPFWGQAGAFAPGDSLRLTLARTNGLWQLRWINLTSSATGASPTYSIPWLDSAPDLYAGILASNARSDTPFVAKVDFFSLTLVPEVGLGGMWSVVPLVIGAVGLLERRRQRVM